MASLDGTLGALFIGTVTSSILHGFNCLQTFIYFQRYEKDPIYLKLVVFSLWILDTMILVLSLKALYYYCVTSFLNLQALSVAPWQIIAAGLVTSIADGTIRCFFARRVFILSGKNWILPIVILCFSFASIGGTFHFSIKALQLKFYSEFSKFKVDFYVLYGTAAIADALIAGTMVYYLRKRRTGIARTNSLLTILSVYCINTAALACMTHIITLITFVTLDNFVYIGVFVCSTKCYYGAFLANLNARDYLRQKVRNSSIQMSPLIVAQDVDKRAHKATTSETDLDPLPPSKSSSLAVGQTYQNIMGNSTTTYHIPV